MSTNTEARECRCGQPATPTHCGHCHDDPPAGHTCPRCGATPIAEATR